jgi:putative acetyltransferase
MDSTMDADDSSSSWVIRPADFNDSQLIELLRFHVGEAVAKSPPGTSYALDLSGLRKPSVRLYVLWQVGQLAGMGAIQELAPDWGELKSMRTAPGFLRRGVAARILDHLLAVARASGYARVSLETGTSADYAPAVALYRRAGFEPGDVYADYQHSPHNQFFHLNL